MAPKSAVVAPLHPTTEALCVTLTMSQLRALLHDEVTTALAEHDAERMPAPLLVGANEMAHMLDVSRATLHRLRVEGCPAVRLGDIYKYEPAAVLAWLKARGGE